MPTKDVISKQLIREIVKDMAIYLLDLQISELVDLPTEKQRIETRQADVVMRAQLEDGERFILHLELQNSNNAKMPLRMMRYFTDIAQAYPNEPIRQYVIYTGEAPLRMRADLAHPQWHYCYTLIDMHTLDCERFIAEDNPDALVLAVLCDFKGRDSKEVLAGIMQRLIELTAEQPDQLPNYLKMLETLSTNRRLEGIFKQLETDMLSKIDIEKLPSYQIGFDQGAERGRNEGLEQGRNEGLELGRNEGLELGRNQALQQTAEKLIAVGGFSDRQIAEVTGLSLAQIEALRLTAIRKETE